MMADLTRLTIDYQSIITNVFNNLTLLQPFSPKQRHLIVSKTLPKAPGLTRDINPSLWQRSSAFCQPKQIRRNPEL